MSDEVIYLLLFLLQLFELAQLQQCSVKRMVTFGKVCPTTKTPLFCAVTGAGVTTGIDKTLTECSGDCANDHACVGFNYKQPQLICDLFQTPFSNLSLTPGCIHYEVIRTQDSTFELSASPSPSFYLLKMQA